MQLIDQNKTSQKKPSTFRPNLRRFYRISQQKELKKYDNQTEEIFNTHVSAKKVKNSKPKASQLRLTNASIVSTFRLNSCLAIEEGKVTLNDGSSVKYVKTGRGTKTLLLLPGALGTAKSDFGPQLEGFIINFSSHMKISKCIFKV